jgi:hypothetical protein
MRSADLIVKYPGRYAWTLELHNELKNIKISSKMKQVITKILSGLIYTIFLFFLINQVVIVVFATIIMYKNLSVSSESTYTFATVLFAINSLLFPLFLIIILFLLFKDKLPVISELIKNFMINKRHLMKAILSGFLYWIVTGLVPVIVILTFFETIIKSRHFNMLIPGSGLFLELLLLFLIYKQLRGHGNDNQ